MTQARRVTVLDTSAIVEAKRVIAPMDLTYEPGDDAVAEVMQRAGDVVEKDAEGEPADPYVLAQALEFRRRGWIS